MIIPTVEVCSNITLPSGRCSKPRLKLDAKPSSTSLVSVDRGWKRYGDLLPTIDLSIGIGMAAASSTNNKSQSGIDWSISSGATNLRLPPWWLMWVALITSQGSSRWRAWANTSSTALTEGAVTILSPWRSTKSCAAAIPNVELLCHDLCLQWESKDADVQRRLFNQLYCRLLLLKSIEQIRLS